MYVCWENVVGRNKARPPEVTGMYLGPGWHSMASALLDAMWYAMWFIAGGAVAIGSCWYAGDQAYRAWQDWEREARSRRRERRTEREAARGLTQIEHYLDTQTPAPAGASPATKHPGTDRRRRWPPTRR